MKQILKTMMVLGLLAAWAVPALADDRNPPPWRGLPGTTTQGWEFNTPNPQPLPDFGSNPWGMLAATVVPTGPWMPVQDGEPGVWPLSGKIDVPIHNFPEAPNPKLIWVQLTWEPQLPGMQPDVMETYWGGTMATLVESDPLPGNPLWQHSTYQIVLPFNPNFEIVHIAGEVNVSELVIDTLCPEPGTLVLLALAGLGLIGYGWRRWKAA